MDIREFLTSYPGVTVATEKDNQDILNFFTQTQIQGNKFDFSYDRSPDFFTFLKLHSRKPLVLIYRDPKDELQGVATMLFRQGYVDGMIAEVCYLGDLRMGFDRKGSATWRKIYGEFFLQQDNIDQFKNVKLFYTCLLDENKLSERSLARNKKSGFAYHPVCSYSMITLMMKKPLATKSSFGVDIGTPTDSAMLIEFYKKSESQLTAGYVFSEEISERLKKWPDFKENNFLVARENGKIVAACALWSPRQCKRILLNRVPLQLQLLSLGKLRPKQELKVLYITNLLFDQTLAENKRSDVFEALLIEAWKILKKSGFHFLSFCDFKEMSVKTAAKNFVTHEVSMAIHEVRVNDGTVPNSKRVYGFEMALV